MAAPDRNRLWSTASPYLRQHAADPVHWQPWDDDALALARASGRPILLSIGYSACHWCHVMARESFADPATAAVMNRLFVCIKVDREERPDLDRLFLDALSRLGRQAGWPLTAFLTPGGVPYWGGGYYPAAACFGLPAFGDVLQDAARRFHEDRDGSVQQGRAITQADPTPPRHAGTTTISAHLLDRIGHELARSVDWLYGGFGVDPPKFLHAGGHEILLRAWRRTGETGLRDAAIGSLTMICNGGVYDHVGGGFHRYAVDDRWQVPHFEKMLCDNAVMIGLLVKAWQATQAPIFAARVAHMIDWLLREMRMPDGAFASSLAADSTDAKAGAFYTWDPGEIRRVLGDGYPAFATAFGQSDDGPFAPRTALFRQAADAVDGPAIQQALATLLRHRNARVPPTRDDKILADWNGLAIAALTEAGLAFDRQDWIAAAQGAFTAVLDRLAAQDSLHHSAFGTELGPAGFLEDYACLAQAALALHEVTGEQTLLAHVRAWTDRLDSSFWDNAGGYFMTGAESGPGPVRQILIDETVAPAGNGTMLGVLPRLALLSGNDRYRHRAEAIVRRFADRLTRASVAGATALNNSAALDRLVQVVIVGVPSDPTRAVLLRRVATYFVPDRLLIVHDGVTAVASDHPAFGKRAVAGRATAYVCVGVTCLEPVTDPGALQEQLDYACMGEASAALRPD